VRPMPCEQPVEIFVGTSAPVAAAASLRGPTRFPGKERSRLRNYVERTRSERWCPDAESCKEKIGI